MRIEFKEIIVDFKVNVLNKNLYRFLFELNEWTKNGTWFNMVKSGKRNPIGKMLTKFFKIL
jgi:hypothetical protein